MTQYGKCSVCGKEAECTQVTFGTNNPTTKPVVLMSTMVIDFAQMCSLTICDECACEKGQSPTKKWATLIISTVLFIPALVAAISAMNRPGSTNPLAIVLMLLLGVLWLTQVISGMMLVMKCGFGKGKTFGLIYAQMIPVVGLLAALSVKKTVDQNTRAISALLPVAKEQFSSQIEKEAELKRQVESGEVTDKALVREVQHNEALKQAQQEKNAETARKGNIGSALCGLAFTLLIMLQGCEAYGSRRGYMELFGSIELSQEAFTLLIVGLFIVDGALLVNALRKR